MGAGPRTEGVTEAGDEQPWRALFGHEEPYNEQVEGIETAIATAREGGFLALEGACGTGKTMLALTAGLELVRDPETRFERVFVLTSVKQQLRQFEADLRTVNENLPEDWRPVSALTLIGKADVCPYNLTNTGGIDDDTVYERCDGLRERTRDLTGDTTAGALVEHARSQQVGLADSGADGGGAADYLEVAGGMAPYEPDTAEYPDGQAEIEYCPFYAQFLEDLPEEGEGTPAAAVPFDYADQGLVEREDLIRLSVEHGTCPHSVMGAVLPRVEVVVGNYYHAFDPSTVGSFTGPLLGEETFVVCDEAHMLEPRVRELVSDGVADATLADAERELSRVVQPLTLGDEESRTPPAGREDTATIRAELEDSALDIDDLQAVRTLLRDLREEIDRRVTEFLDREHREWRVDMTGLEDAELPLRDPSEPGTDELTRWAATAGHDREVWAKAEAAGVLAARALNTVENEEKQRASPAAGRALAAWVRCDHTDYFREISLRRTWNDAASEDSWRRAYNARLELYNCLPRDAIGERLSEFGAGVLMSATLEPLDAFAAVTGLEHLADEDRPVETRTYGLGFPDEHRASYAVATPKFTYANRGPTPDCDDGARAPDADTSKETVNGDETDGTDREVGATTRHAYVRGMTQVAASPGNVLVGMPSYAEAEWAANVLEDRVDKPVLLDEPTRDAVTQRVKEEFFAGNPKVLVTSLRGTLTEGVDYRGDRLRAAVVCGVPLVNTNSPRTNAVRTAYDREFGDGFRYALAVPAVRKARQALGRVIRGPDEVGVRVLLDERYARDSWDSVRDLLGAEREEYQPVSPDMLSLGLDRFWTDRS